MGEPFNSNMQMRLTINNAIRNLENVFTIISAMASKSFNSVMETD